MEMKPENIPDELLIQAKVVHSPKCTVTNSNKYPRHCSRDLGHLHNWLRHPNNASRRI